MRRAAAVTALAAVAALAVPAVPAYACSRPTGFFEVESDPVVAGSTVVLHGEVTAGANGHLAPCTMPVPLTPSPEPETEVATARPDPGPTPLVTLPPLVPVAYTAPAPVGVTLSGDAREWELGSIAANPNRWYAPGLLLWSFRGRVTVPADVPPGDYTLSAAQPDGVAWGWVGIRVTRGLAATGTPAAALVNVALLALLTGAGALGAARLVRQ